MSNPSNPFTPGDPVLALHRRGGERYWVPGVVRSVDSSAARVELSGGGPRRVPFSRLRLGAPR